MTNFKFILLVLLSFIFVQNTDAHRMNIQYSVENNNLNIRAIYGMDDAITGASVSIYNSTGTLLSSGTTTKEGNFQWPIEHIDDLQIRIQADAGHAKILAIEKEQLISLMDEAENQDNHLHNEEIILEHHSHEPQENPSRTIISTENSWGMPERIILGFTFLLAAWSAWTSQRNSKKLDQITKIISSESNHQS